MGNICGGFGSARKEEGTVPPKEQPAVGEHPNQEGATGTQNMQPEGGSQPLAGAVQLAPAVEPLNQAPGDPEHPREPAT